MGSDLNWDADTVNKAVLLGDGERRFRFDVDAKEEAAIGLNRVNDGTDVGELDFSLRSSATGDILAFDGLLELGNFGPYLAKNLFSIERLGSDMIFKRNGAVLHTATEVDTGPLFADIAFLELNTRPFALPNSRLLDSGRSIGYRWRWDS